MTESSVDNKSKNRKSPYFSLADPALLKPLLEAIAHASTLEALKNKPNPTIYRSLREIFGAFNKMSDDHQAKFLLAILKNGAVEPNWKAAANDLGTMNSHNV